MRITVTTYDELQEFIHHFMIEVYELLIIEGAHGIGKSSAVKHMFSHMNSETDYCWLEGRVSAPVFFEKLYQYLDCPIILDDCDSFITDKQSLNLLKTLCQTDKDKRVSWQTLRKLTNNVPTEFDTSSTVILICNEFKRLGAHFQAVEDRGLHILFQPSIEEIHKYAIKVCSIEVYQFFSMFLHTIKDISLRQYVIAEKLYKQGLEWRKVVSQSWGLDPLVQLYMSIVIDYPELTQEDRKDKFIKLSKKTERTYERVIETLNRGK